MSKVAVSLSISCSSRENLSNCSNESSLLVAVSSIRLASCLAFLMRAELIPLSVINSSKTALNNPLLIFP